MGNHFSFSNIFRSGTKRWKRLFRPAEEEYRASASMYQGVDVPKRLELFFADATDACADAIAQDGARARMRANARKVFLSEGCSNHGSFTLGIHVTGTKGPNLSMIPENVPGTSSVNPREPELSLEERSLLESEWFHFAQEIDLSEHIRTAVEALEYDGEIFFQMVFDPQIEDVQFNLQQVEAKRVRFPMESGQNEDMVNGIEFCGLHPKNYFVVPKVMNPALDWSWEPEAVPAKDMIHFAVMRLPDQHRGIPWMDPVLYDIAETNLYEGYHLGAANAAARNSGGVLECNPNARISGNGDVKLNPDGMEVWEPNHIKQLKPGVTYKQGNAAWPAGAYGPFIDIKREKHAAGMHLTKAMLTNNFEKHNYSSFRGEMLVYWKTVQYLRERIERMILNRVFDRWMECFAVADPTADAVLQRFRKSKRVPRCWTWEPIPAYDRSDFISSLREAVEAGFMSRKMAVAELGYDFEQVEAERKEDTLESSESADDPMSGKA